MVESWHCDQGMSKNTPASIICFFTLLLEVSQDGGRAYRGFTSPLATLLCFSVPAQGIAFSSPGVRRQRQGTHLFYYSWALQPPGALAEGLQATQAQLNKLSRATAETSSLPVTASDTEAWAPHLLPLALTRPRRESMSLQAGARCLGWGWGTDGEKPAGWNRCRRCRAGAGAGAVGSLRGPQTCPHPDLLQALTH